MSGSYRFVGVEDGRGAGWFVSAAGNVTGGVADGTPVDDILIGTFGDSPGGRFEAGSVYLVAGTDLAALDDMTASGGAAGDMRIELADVAAGANSYRFNGIAAGDRAGVTVASAGDVDGDGRADILIGAYWADPSGRNMAGEAYLISSQDLAALDDATANGGVAGDGVIELADVAGAANSYRFLGLAAGDNAGFFVSSAGDFDNDGIADLLIASPYTDTRPGEVYLISGGRLDDLDNATGSGGTADDGIIDLGDVAATAGHYRIVGSATGDLTGISVSGVGDIDADGHDDFMFGVLNDDPGGRVDAGSVFLVSGAGLDALDDATPNGGTADDGIIEIVNVAGTAGSYQFIGPEASGRVGFHVSSAGDFDDDGIPDLIIGSNSGTRVYLISGADLETLDNQTASGGVSGDGVIALADVVRGAHSYQINTSGSVGIGYAVGTAGDVDGDGLSDLLIGLNEATYEGGALVVSAADLAYFDGLTGNGGVAGDRVIELVDTLYQPGSYWLVGQKAGDWAGRSVSPAGDVDGDGQGDFLVGAPQYGGPLQTGPGMAYLVSGADIPDLDDLNSFEGIVYLRDIGPICFAADTLIATPSGPVAAGMLAPGDSVLTLDHGAQTVRWIGRRRVGAAELAARPGLRPVRIRAGALGPGLPDRDLLVSPQHRLLVRSRIAERMFASREVLVPAVKLLGAGGIGIAQDMAEVTYVHILCDRHEILFANGAPAESLLTGPEAMRSLPPGARAEILALFPGSPWAPPRAARPVHEKAGPARALARRHRAQGRPLVDA